MNTVKTHQMNLQNEPFELIKNKTKTIEMRLYDEKRSKIKIGDIIEFNNDNSNQIIKTKVKEIHKFSSFDELYNSFDKIKIGYKENEIPNPNHMSQYYKQDEINKYGVVGIEIELIDNIQ